MGATCSTPFRYGIDYGDVCPKSCGKCPPATTPKPLENPFCIKIVTGKTKYDDGYVGVYIDTGKGLKKEVSGKKKFGLGKAVLPESNSEGASAKQEQECMDWV